MSTRSSDGYTRRTSPRLPLSLPEVTITLSPFFTRAGISQHLRGERNDLHVVLGPELARHGTEDARSDRLVLRRDQHSGVRIEANERAIGPAHAMRGAYDDGLEHFALLNATA